MRTRVVALISCLACACSHAEPESPSDAVEERWRSIKNEIRTKFADVRTVTTEQLRKELAAPGDQPLLVDVRSAEEYAVSHLPGARHAPAGEGLTGIPKDRPIVVYCSVGYRSAQAARKLTAAGYGDVRNYLGSIFEWANRGLPVENASGPTDKVHPYDADWGKLLDATTNDASHK